MFKCPFCQSDVVLGCVVCSHLCVVNYTGGQAFVVKRALVFVTAIALYLVNCTGVIVGISYFLVVFVDDRFHVVHAAVADFDVILVEKAVVFVLFREVLRNKFEKCSADVSLDVFTERRVVPDNISLSVAFYIFVDDTILFYSNSNLAELESIVSYNLRMVSDWLMANKVSFNIDKTNFT